MGKNIDLQSMLKKAVKKAMKEDIEPVVKYVYKQKAKELKNIRSKKNDKIKTAESKKKIAKTAQKIADRMSDDDYVVSSTKYLDPVDADNGAFSVYNNKPLESLPGWKDPYAGKKTELSFTKLVVGGNILIHPALTDYREDYNLSGKMSEDEWNTYKDKKNYRFEGQKFVNQAMNDLEKNYVDEFQEMIAKRLLEEYKKNK